MIVAFAVPAMATLVLGATDVASIMADRQRMRSIAEASALAGARNLSVAMSESDALQHARAWAESMVVEWPNGPHIDVTAEIVTLQNQAKGLRVTLDARRHSFFNDLLPPGGWQYDASVTASSVGAVPLCMLVFTARSQHDFWVKDSATISAPGCLVHSDGNIVVSGGKIEAGRTQAVLSATGDIAPDPVTDAPPIDDPFATLPIDASIVKCAGSSRSLLNSATVLSASTGVHTLPPGDHCGVIDISGDATLVLQPGEHRFGAGLLTVRENARLTGVDVVMVMDKLWKTSFLDNAVVSLSGREEGLLAGFVMIADRDNTQPFVISASHVERLDGVLYVPNAELRISSQGPVASKSDWTVVVAKNLRLSGNANLVMNVNYGASDVDVPKGVGPRGGTTRLVE